MAICPDEKPRLRPVEPVRLEGEEGLIALRDPSGLSPVVLSISPAALQILACLDGEHTLDDIRATFHRITQQPLSEDTLARVVENLRDAHLLEGPAFEEHYASLLKVYRDHGVREMPHADQLGLADGSGNVFRDMLKGTAPPDTTSERIRGVVAPHLDYPRGKPCYALAYGALRERPPPKRVIVLGTNHFGRSTSPVATGSAFATPLGTTNVDLDFLERLEARCGELRRFELDHAREHSVELQVAWLQYLYGARSFAIVPILCNDPCGPTGTEPRDGAGVDLAVFASALRDLLAEDPLDTLLVAGADLSHVGPTFGDARPLAQEQLQGVRRADEALLTELQGGGPEALVRLLRRTDNATRVCSAGCLYVLSAALPSARSTILGYHQAVDEAAQTCVTCAAMIYTGDRA